MFRIKKIIPLCIAVLCIASIFAGCKVELPKVSAQSQQSALESTAQTSNLLSQPESNVPSVVNSAVSSAKTTSSGTKVTSSKPTSSKATAGSANPKADGSQPSASKSPVPAVQNNQLTCSLKISCETLLNHMDELDPSTKSIVPKNGVIYAEHTANFTSGESVFDVLLRETRNNGIPLDYQSTSVYSSAYVTNIGGLGKTLNTSGWMYSVNGVFKNAGCSRVILKNGDKIEWHYTCENGRDLR